jgi:hypothetical protein
MGGMYRTYGGYEKFVHSFSRETWRKDHMGDLEIRGEDNIKFNCRYIESEHVDWIELVQDIAQWWTVVNTIMNLWVP